jgi:endonuclease/exonuclease/phosphatase family metal-dependent hydrolase
VSELKLVSLNIEWSKHLDLVVPFVRSVQPDVVCFQELCEKDIDFLADSLSLTPVIYAPCSNFEFTPGVFTIQGVGIFSRLKTSNTVLEYYVGDAGYIPQKSLADPATYALGNHALITADVESEGAEFRIATTHFTWTKDGQPNDEQRQSMQKLLSLLETKKDFVLTGDFNAARGGEMFGELASKYADNIPAQYKTSIDITLHRAGKTAGAQLSQYMVDGLFTTPAYAVKDVTLVGGVSDHFAIVATIQKK